MSEREAGTLAHTHVLLLIGAFAGLFYSFGLAVGGAFPHNTVGDGVAGMIACVILLGTAFLLDPDRPMLDDGNPS